MRYLVTKKRTELSPGRAYVKVCNGASQVFDGYADTVEILEGEDSVAEALTAVLIFPESECIRFSEAMKWGAYIKFQYEGCNEWNEMTDVMITDGPYHEYIRISGILR